MKLCILDLETYWDQNHSLSKMPPIEYCMHSDTEIISCAFKFVDGGQVDDTFVQFGEGTVKRFCATIPWHQYWVVGHNMSAFDSMICAWRLGIKPKLWGCTLAMARPIHAKTTGLSLAALVEHYGIGKKDNTALVNTKGKHLKDFTQAEKYAMREYNRADVDQCYELLRRLIPQTKRDEVMLIDMTIRMLVEPQFDCDFPLLWNALDKAKEDKHRILLELADRLGIYHPTPENYAASHIIDGVPYEDQVAETVRARLASAPKFAQLLEELGHKVPMKESPTTPGKMIPALAKTDVDFVAMTESDDETLAAAANARLGVKSTLLETRIKAFIDASSAHPDGKVPLPLHYYGADTTGRWSGWGYNPQNLPRVNPKDPKLSDVLRKSLRAPPGHKVVVADLSGIELRVNMFLWKVPYAMELFAENPDADLYKPMASETLGVPIEGMPKMVRQAGKAQHLGCFTADVYVLTSGGAKHIVDVLATDLLWDGEEWVTHAGLVYQGEQEVVHRHGVGATKDHKILTRDGWKEWLEVCGNPHLFQSALESANSLSLRGSSDLASSVVWGTTHSSGALVGGRGLSTGTISKRGRLLGVIPALNRQLATGLSGIGSTLKLLRTTGIGHGYLTALLPPSDGATATQSTRTTTEIGGSRFTPRGVMIEPRFCGTSSHSKGGTHQNSKWTELTTIKGICQVISGLFLGRRTQKTEGQSKNYKPKSTDSKKKSSVYDIVNSGPRSRFTILSDKGPLVVHNCGFGLRNPEKYRAVAKQMAGIDVTLEEAEHHIMSYRRKHPQVVKGWKRCGDLLPNMARDADGEIAIDPWGLCHAVAGGIRTPRGMVRYPDLKFEMSEDKRGFWYGRGRKRTTIYSGKIVENCIAAGTFVLTDSGWKPIQHVSLSDKVHDGVEFVAHQGIISKTVQPCVKVDGAYMTADHKVLTHDGWKEASQLQGPNRSKIRYVDSGISIPFHWQNVGVDVPVRLRKASRQSWFGRHKGGETRRHTKLRLRNWRVNRGEELDPRDEQTPSIRSVSVHDRSVQTTITSGMEKLRRPWNSGLRAVAHWVRTILGGHGWHLSAGVGFGSDQQQWAVLPGELPVDYTKAEHAQQAEQHTAGYPENIKTDRHRAINIVLPMETRQGPDGCSGQTESHEVFDIVNAGPRQRFIIHGDSGAFIVHNCVQHLARNIIADQALRVQRELGLRLALTVHDELVYIVPEDQAQEALDNVQTIMRQPVSWWPELILWSEGDIADTYGDAK